MRRETGEILELMFDRVYVAKDGTEAIELFGQKRPDIILSDIKMPKKDGIDFVRYVRQHDFKIPIVLITALVDQNILISAANLSIDGYIIKPINLEKLVETLDFALNRTKSPSLFILKSNGRIAFDVNKKELIKDGLPVSLGAKEALFLEKLILAHPSMVSKEEILATIYPLDDAGDAVIKSLVFNLKKKIGKEPIVPVRGLGYRLEIK